MEQPHWRHRAPKKSRPWGTIALTAALVLTGAAFVLKPSDARQMNTAPVDLVVPPLSGDELNAWCKSRVAAGTAGLSTNAKNWLRACVEVSNPLPSPSPTGTPSPTPTTPSPTPTTPSPSPTTPSPTPTTPSPTPTTPSPSPSPSPTGPAFPDATTTGVPAGTTLKTTVPSCVTVVSYGWVVAVDGCVIDSQLVPGQLEVRANNVTIRNSRVMCSSDNCINEVAGSGLTVSHVEIGPNTGYANVNSARAINGGNALTVVAVNIHNTVDGIWPGSNTTVVDSYIHNLDITGDGAHSDGIQTSGGASNVVIRHNTIEGGNTSDMLVQKIDGLDNAWVIDGNLLLGRRDTGGVTSYAVGFDKDACPANNCQFTNNVLNRTWEVGPSYIPTNWTAASWFGNTYQDNGATVPVPA